MITLAANIPLTLCSVVIRRFIDSYTGRLPLAVASSTVANGSTVALFSGALICLYHQLRKGTLVKIGLGKGISSMIRNSRHTIQRRVKNSSWLLRNLNSCRRKCAEAVFKIAQSSNDSLAHIQAETGLIDTNSINETTSLPIFNRRRRSLGDGCKRSETPLENLFSNESFDCNDFSAQDIRSADKGRSRRQRNTNNESISHRPVTRNFRRAAGELEACGDGRRETSKKRRKSEIITTEIEQEPPKMENNHPPAATRSSRFSRKKYSERLKKMSNIQKITRKTRSGRVYAYRL